MWDAQVEPETVIIEQPTANDVIRRKSKVPDGGQGMLMLKLPPSNCPDAIPLEPIEGCPLGLEYLIPTTEFTVEEPDPKMDEVRMSFGVHLSKKLNILNSDGQRIYIAGGGRGTEPGSALVTIYDLRGQPVLMFEHPKSPTSCFNFGQSGAIVRVVLGDATVLGDVIQQSHGTQPLFHLITTEEKVIVAKAMGSKYMDCCCSSFCSCCISKEFEFLNPNDTFLGKITKEYTETPYTFGANFPQELDVRTKALLLGALFLIDLMFLPRTVFSTSDTGSSLDAPQAYPGASIMTLAR